MTDQIQTPSREDQFVAALGHAGAFVPTFGVLIPFIIWISQKDRSAYLKIQALQATIWQLIFFIAQILFSAGYFAVMVLLIPIGMAADSGTGNLEPAAGGAAAAALVTLIFGIMLLFFIGWLVYFIAAIVGIVQSLRGEPFKYLLIGSWLEKRLNPEEVIETEGNVQSEDDQTD